MERLAGGHVMFQTEIEVATEGPRDVRADGARRRRRALVRASTTGLCHVFTTHTSASLMICENADPDVRRDLETFMADLAPDGDPRFVHTAEGPDDMPAHVRSVLTHVGSDDPDQGRRARARHVAGRVSVGAPPRTAIAGACSSPSRARQGTDLFSRTISQSSSSSARCCPRLERLQRAARDVGDLRRAHLRHDDAQLAREDVEHALDAWLAERAQAPDVRPADADGRRAERERFEDVGAAAEAAVDEHRNAPADGFERPRASSRSRRATFRRRGRRGC